MIVQLTILMPCLNEVETLSACIHKANGWIVRTNIDAEVLIADNGSTDGSRDIARNLGARVVDVSERGFGAALYCGSQAARGEWIIMGDSDDSYDFSNLDYFVTKLREGYDLLSFTEMVDTFANSPSPCPPPTRGGGTPGFAAVAARSGGCALPPWRGRDRVGGVKHLRNSQ